MARNNVERNIAYDDCKKKYYVRFYYGLDERKKPIAHYFTFDKLKDARKALRAHEVERDKGIAVIPKKLTVSDWLNEWLETVILPNAQETTVYGYRNIINNHMVPYFGKTALQDLSANKIQKYYAYLSQEKGLSNNTIIKHHDLLKAALKTAENQNSIYKNPVNSVKVPTTTDPDISFYTAEELRKLFDVVKGTRLQIMVELGGYLGLRREEILGLKWEDVDFDKQVINIRHARTAAGKTIVEKSPKNKSSARTLSYPDELNEHLKAERKRQEENKALFKTDYFDTGYVIVDELGKPLRPNYASYLFTKCIEDNKLPHLTLHGLRHTFASVANEMGVPLFEISKELGHSTPVITGKIYTHVFDETHKDSINIVANRISKKSSEE